ncbi:MAG: acyl-CoA dehydrogenase family protein, partial [Acidimicrobiales bacterium]
MTEDSLVDPLVTETAHRLLSEICDHESIQAAEARGQAPEIWNAFAETGFPWISIDEDAGGSGGSLLDALEVLRLVGYHAAPIPAAETGILGGWLLANSSQELPDGITTVVP